MAIISTAVEITVNTDNSYTIIIDCDFLKKDEKKDNNDDEMSMVRDDLTFSAKTPEEVSSILLEYLPKLQSCSESDIKKNAFDFYSRKK